jgi:hypothetical protein
MLNLKDETTLNTLLNSKDIKYTNDTGKITHIKLSTLTRLSRRDLDPRSEISLGSLTTGVLFRANVI